MISLGYDHKHWMNHIANARADAPIVPVHAELREDPMDCRRFPRGLVVENGKARHCKGVEEHG